MAETNSLQAVFSGLTFKAVKQTREISGRILPWGRPGTNNSGTYVFERGSVVWDEANPGRVKLFDTHKTAGGVLALMGVATSIQERLDGLYGTFKVANTPEGDRILALAGDGILDGFSVGVSLTRKDGITTDHGVFRVQSGAQLNEVSVVSEPAFHDARILSVAASAASGSTQFDRMGVPMTQRYTVTREASDYAIFGGTSEHSFIADLIASRGEPESDAAARVLKTRHQLKEGSIAFGLGTTSNLPELGTGYNGAQGGRAAASLVAATPLQSASTFTPIPDSQPFWVFASDRSSNGFATVHVEGVNAAGATLSTGDSFLVEPVAVEGAMQVTRELYESQTSPVRDYLVFGEALRAANVIKEAQIAAALTAATGLGATGSVTGNGITFALAVKNYFADATMRMDGTPPDRLVIEADAFKALLTQNEVPAASGQVSSGRALYPILAPEQGAGVSLDGFPAKASKALTTASYLFPASALLTFETPIQDFKIQEKNGPALINLSIWSYFAAHVLHATDVVRIAYTVG